MKKRLRYSLLVLLLALLNTMAGKAVRATENDDAKVVEQHYISQTQAQKESARILYFIYSHSLTGTIAMDHHGHDVKSFVRSFCYRKSTPNKHLPTLLSDQYLYSSLHRDPVGYYVFTLGKIVT